MVRLNELLAVCGVGEQESVAVTLIELVPVPVGVPERSPELDSVNPAGTPVALQVTGLIPPAEVNWNEYACPWVAAGNGDVLTRLIAGHATVRAKALVVKTVRASVTLAVKFAVPVAVGVPVIVPVLEDRDSPDGRLPAERDQT